ncbi:MAG: guanylate kinase [Candidatus Zophobacter franzmannii]|jgi:guanylate kinase|nr:guanylate kinase [Candidatus Zophobacter franzmannii]
MHREDYYPTKPFLIILSAPSGGGKTTILIEILKETENIDYSISYTTRKPRKGEENGKHYFFVDEDEFKEMIERDDFLEHALVHGNYYGTSKSYIRSRMDLGRHVIMDIDVQGAAQITNTDLDIVKIFILPPDKSILEQRLRDRGTDSDEVIIKRLTNADTELNYIKDYKYTVINDDLAKAVSDVKAIIVAEELQRGRYSDLNKKFYRG